MSTALTASPTEARFRLANHLSALDEAWSQSEERIAELLWDYQLLSPIVPQDLRTQLYNKAGALYPAGPERWAKLFDLPEQIDVNRAIKYDLAKTTGEADREPGDEVFPTSGFLGRYVRWTDGSTSPVGYRFWSAVALLGACCRRTVYLDMGHYEIYPAYLAVLSGTSGRGKGVALRAMHELLTRVNRKIDECKAYDAEVRKIILPYDKNIRVLFQNVTPESLIDSLKTNEEQAKGIDKDANPWFDSTGVFLLRELGSLLGQDNFHRGKMVEFLLDMYDCPPYHDASTIRRGRAYLLRPTITLVGCTTPRWIRNNFTEDLFLEGLIGRFTFAHREMPTERPKFRRARDPVEAESLADYLLKFALAERRRSFMMEPAVEDWLEAAEDEAWDLALGDEKKRGYYLRLAGAALRLAVILSLSRGQEGQLELPDVQLAQKILAMEEQNIERCLMQVGRHQDADLVPFFLTRLLQLGGRASHTELYRKCSYKLPVSEEFQRVARSAKEMGYLDITANGRAKYYTITREGKEEVRG